MTPLQKQFLAALIAQRKETTSTRAADLDSPDFVRGYAACYERIAEPLRLLLDGKLKPKDLRRFIR